MSFVDIPCDGAWLGALGDCPTFHFAVVGDTHTHRPTDPAEQSETTNRIIDELNLLRPDFVLSAGDLIRGYTDDEARLRIEHEGAKRAFARLEMPFLPCIGNHDVREPVSERVWSEFWGGRWYSFDWADCHFLVLDAEIGKDVESVEGAQLEWVREDLARRARGKRLFVTLHRPWWYDRPLHKATWKGPGLRNDWNDIVDPILRRHDLRAIFTGHIHRFELDVRAGVPHVVAGGAGGDIKLMPERGGIAHYLWVSVRPGGFRWSVIVPGQIVGEDTLRDANADFRAIMPWIDHPRAARHGGHWQAENAPSPPPRKLTIGERVRRIFGRREDG